MTVETTAPAVTIIGADSLVGEELGRVLAAREFPMKSLVHMGQGDDVGRIVEFAGEAQLVVEMDPERLQGCGLVFICARGDGARAATAAALAGPVYVIDLVDAEAGAPACSVQMDVNAAALPAAAPARVCNPHQAAQGVAVLVDRLSRDHELTDLALTVLTPVSDAGAAAVQELYRQTTAVLNFEEKPQEVFQRQVAFNVVPHALMHTQQGWPDLDARLQRELSQVLDMKKEAVTVRALLSPVFHGLGVLVSAGFDAPVPAEWRRQALAASPFDPAPRTQAELAESEAVHVVELDSSRQDRVDLWMVTDNLRGGGVTNAVRIAEALFSRNGVQG